MVRRSIWGTARLGRPRSLRFLHGALRATVVDAVLHATVVDGVLHATVHLDGVLRATVHLDAVLHGALHATVADAVHLDAVPL
jgi:hypothetical protein